jgi:protein-S-isoprenylcysteine O-methyltransferase Ste14
MDKPAERVGWLCSRRPADFLLLGVTAVELAILFVWTEDLRVTDWIYACSNLLVLVIAMTRRPAQVQDRSIGAAGAVLVSYAYPYAQMVVLHWRRGHVMWPRVGFVVVIVGAVMSLAGLISLGRFFGVRPALRGLATGGMYRVVRHPLYLAYMIQDIGYNLDEWSVGTLVLVALGWASMIYRIGAEERVLSRNAAWAGYAGRVRWRLLPGVW